MQTVAKTNGTLKPKYVADTHRHPLGPKLITKMVERGLYDPKKRLPQTAAGDVIIYRTLVDLDYAMIKQREGGVTLSVASNGGEVEWLGRDILQTNTNETLRFLNDEYLEIRDRYPGEFALMANAHALEEGCRDVVDVMLSKHDAKAIAVSSSCNVLADRQFLDSPKAEWLWEYAAAKGVPLQVDPPNMAISHEAANKYCLNEALARPYDSALSVARMIGSGVFDRHPKLQIIVVHMGGDLMSVLGRLDFCWLHPIHYTDHRSTVVCAARRLRIDVRVPCEFRNRRSHPAVFLCAENEAERGNLGRRPAVSRADREFVKDVGRQVPCWPCGRRAYHAREHCNGSARNANFFVRRRSENTEHQRAIHSTVL